MSACEPWPYSWPCNPDEAPDLARWEPEVVDLVVQAATDTLWARTGRRYGLCAVTVQPCAGTDVCVPPSSSYVQAHLGSMSLALHWGCPCAAPCRVPGVPAAAVVDLLQLAPIAELRSVTIGGSGLAVTGSGAAAGVASERYLVRRDGEAWPTDGTWSATVAVGEPVPAGGRLAMGELVSEMLKACSGDSSCRLPARLQSTTRRGVQQQGKGAIEFDDPRLGLPLADQWIRDENPHGLAAPAAVLSPDYRPPSRPLG